jgi:hypothetical protein
MKINPNKLWILVIALGWTFDFLFWKQPPGLNFAIFTTLCVGAALYLLLSEGNRPHPLTLYLIPPFGFFAVVTFLRAEPMTTFLAYTITLLLMTLLSVSYLGGRWMRYSILDYIGRAVGLIGSLVARPVIFGADARKARVEAGLPPPKFNLWPVARGLLIALPVVAVFASLLASADVIFEQRLDEFIELFKLEKLPEYIFRLVYIMMIAYGLAGAVLHAAYESKDESLAGRERSILPPFLGFIESGIILGSVVILFAAFVAVQFQYFFGGNANIHLEGYTYSEYARRGFGELVTVAFFALLLLFTLSSVTRRETEPQRRIFSGLGVTVVALLMVMLVSAYQRLNLYEAVYGFSRLRTYTHVFLVWLGLLLLATIVLEILRREQWFTFAALAASLGFVSSLAILNVDGFIVRQNIQREVVGSALGEVDRVDLDAGYFMNLSDDAIPALADTYHESEIAAEVKEKVGAALACIRQQRSLDQRERTWKSFHYARFRADRVLESMETELDRFKIKDG